jgi:hypothetical protein
VIPGMSELMAGNDAGWLLSFHKETRQSGKVRVSPGPAELEVGRDQYYADIRASLPGGLEGGVYSFTIEGLTDSDYAKIAGSRAPVVKLYLYWREAVGGLGGALASLAGLTDVPVGVTSEQLADWHVATLRVESITRKAGARRYETTITARERAFDVVATTPLCTAIDKPIDQAVKELLGTHAGFDDYKWWGFPPNAACPPLTTAPTPAANVVLTQGQMVLTLLAQLGGKMEEASGNYGRGMFLIRRGDLHVGVRPTPLGQGKPPTELTAEGGLVEVEPLPAVASDPTFDVCAGLKSGQSAPTRRQFQLTLKGRPDLFPGDLVRFDAPPQETSTTGGGSLLGGIVGSFVPELGAPNPVQLYVASVEHRLSRTAGFVTTVTGLEVGLADVWDCHSVAGRNGASEPAAASGPETQAAQAVRSAARELIGAKSWLEVGEARGMTAQGSASVPPQTETVWRGLEPGDGQGNQSRRLEIARPSTAPLNDVPYASPFAWDSCGLVLPRYPGTRVLVSHRDGRDDEPIDVGALWADGKGPKSKDGDWWLILPIAASTTPPANDTDPPPEYTGKVTQDLIDASGNRWIEAGELTIRIGTGKLKNAGDRPDDPADRGGLTILHPDSEAKIQIKRDGTIVIESPKKLELTGKDGVAISAPDKDVTIDAANVNVTVSGAMDVG